MSQNEAEYKYSKDEKKLIAIDIYNGYVKTMYSMRDLTHSGYMKDIENENFKQGFIAGIKYLSLFIDNNSIR